MRGTTLIIVMIANVCQTTIVITAAPAPPVVAMGVVYVIEKKMIHYQVIFDCLCLVMCGLHMVFSIAFNGNSNSI